MANNFADLLTDPDTKVCYIHQKALDTLQAMVNHSKTVGRTFGLQSPEYTAEASSLIAAVGQIFTFGFDRQQHVTRDGELSLLVNEAGAFVFGVVFFPDRKYDNPPEGYVQPGTWSCHS